MNVLSRAVLAVLLTASGLSAAHAAVQIIGTRVIYPAGEREVTVAASDLETFEHLPNKNPEPTQPKT